jgi:copper homeostasis protein (lipoprotein)
MRCAKTTIHLLLPLAVLLTSVIAGGCSGEEEGGGSARSDGAESSTETADTTSSRSMVGMYSYLADAGVFAECPGGTPLPVAHEVDNAALERAYLYAREEPGEPVLVTLEGRVQRRPRMEGDGTRDYLIVDRFRKVWPGENCEKVSVETPLINTHWHLVELNGKPVETHPGQREIYLRLRPDVTQLMGFAGCNQFKGRYALDGPALRFERLASTLTACPYLDEERAYLDALETVTGYEILGETLDLNCEDRVVARFKAVYFE